MQQIPLLLLLLLLSLEANAQNWFKTNGPVEDEVFDICIDSNGILYAVTPLGVNRSTDGGERWTRPFLFPAPSPSFNRMMVAPNGNIIVSSSSGIFTSTDKGDSFTRRFQSGNPTFIQFATTGNGRIFLTHTANFLYSDNNGMDWSVLPDWKQNPPFAVAASRDTVIVHTQTSAFYSIDNGESWGQIMRATMDVFKLLILPNGTWICTDYGSHIYRYDSRGMWIEFRDNRPDSLYMTNVNVMRDGSMLIGTLSGLYLLKDTATWINVTSGFGKDENGFHYPVYCFIEDPKKNTCYAATVGGGVWKSAGTLTNRDAKDVLPSLSVWPNPLTNHTTISSTYAGRLWSEVELRNILGTVIWKNGREYSGNRTFSIDVSGIPAGSYLLVLRTNERTETQWITITK